MIKMKVLEAEGNNVKKQFIITADEPVTIEFMETDKEQVIACVYKGNEKDLDEYSEPVGKYDSDIPEKGWQVN